MKKRFVSAFAVITVITLLLCGCGCQEMNDDASSETSSPVSTQDSSATSSTQQRFAWIAKGEVYPIVIKVGETDIIPLIQGPLDENYDTAKVQWVISDESIVTFARDEYTGSILKNRASCTIVGLKPGQVIVRAYVTAEDGNCSASCIVTVVE